MHIAWLHIIYMLSTCIPWVTGTSIIEKNATLLLTPLVDCPKNATYPFTGLVDCSCRPATDGSALGFSLLLIALCWWVVKLVSLRQYNGRTLYILTCIFIRPVTVYVFSASLCYSLSISASLSFGFSAVFNSALSSLRVGHRHAVVNESCAI